MNRLRNRFAGLPAAWLALAVQGIAFPLHRAQADTLPNTILRLDNPRMAVKTVVPLRAVAFAPEDVRLLDGPFKTAQEADRAYLRSLDPDRMLHNFRVNAGLLAPAKPYGGWDAPDGEQRGAFVGHYLSACAQMAQATGDPILKRNGAYIVAELAKCQQKIGSGYLSAFPESFIERVIARKPVWAPWYAIHKIHAGLIDQYVLSGNRQALVVARGMADWAKQRTETLTDAQMQAMLEEEQGGITESLANLAALTGEAKYLRLAERFNHHAVVDPLSRGEDQLTGLHANTQIPKIIGAAREYELTGDPARQKTAITFWNVVTKERSYVIGGHSDAEHFSPKEHLSEYLSPTTTETCNTYNMLKLTQHLFAWEPSAATMDYYERALYNHILASQNHETGMMCYYVPLHSGSKKVFNTPTDSFWCCTGTGVENHARYNQAIYAHGGGSDLYVNLFIASTLNWREKKISLRQETAFPSQAGSRITITQARSARFTLRVRRPAWAGNDFQVEVNGKAVDAPIAPDGYAVVSRIWKTGDVIDVRLPMRLHTEGFRDNPNRLAFLYGPIVLCAPTNARNDIPALVTAGGAPAESVTPDNAGSLRFRGVTGRFRVAGQTSDEAVTFEPFYNAANERYVVYWDRFTPAQWQVKEAEYAAEQAAQRELEARTVDAVHPGEEQSERDHRQAGEQTNHGDFDNRKWRDAGNGGWFSYELKVLPDVKQELVVTYWGSDGGGREFDILADGIAVASVTLANNAPDKFFTVAYPLPPALAAGKARVTFRFAAHPGKIAGGVFAVKVVKAK